MSLRNPEEGQFMFNWITDHVQAALTFLGAVVVNTAILGMVYGSFRKRLETVERCQAQCPETFVRKDVLQPQLDTIKQDLSEVKKDIKSLLARGHGQ